MVGSVAPASGGSSGDVGSIGSSGLTSFDLGGIAPNGGGPAPTGTGDLGAAGLSPIGSSGLTAFGPPGGPSEAAKLDRYNDLVQQNWDQLDAARRDNEALSKSIAEIGPPITTPSFTAQPLDPASFALPPTPGFALPPPPGLGPLPMPAFTGQPLGAGPLVPPPPAVSTFIIPEAAGGPAAPPVTPTVMAPDALASPVTRPDIPAPPAPVDPFAPLAAGGLGLTAPAGDGVAASAVPETAAPTEVPNLLGRVGERIGDNFTQAFSTPLGPGEAYRDFVSPLTTPTGYGAFDAVAQPIYNGALIGVPSLLDAAGRTIGAAYSSLVDGGTEVLTSAGMDRSSAERLGRDLKAMPEAFAGSPLALKGPRVAPPQPVTVYRVEGAGNRRIELGESGSVDIPPVYTRGGAERNLYLNFGKDQRAQEFLEQRLGQFPDSEVRSFQVPQSFLDELRATAVPEAQRSLHPDRPVIADPTRASDQFGLSGDQIERLRGVIIPGTGLRRSGP